MVEETFFLLEIFLLLAHCCGSTPHCDTVTVQQGETANITFNFNNDISALRYNFRIQRFDLNNTYRDTVLHCFWIDEKETYCQQLKGFSFDVNGTRILCLKINQASKNDSGIYECSVISNGVVEEVCKLSVIVQDAQTITLVTSEGLTEDASETTANSSFSENVDEGQSYKHFIPLLLGIFVLLGAVVLILRIVFPNINIFKYCKCHHSDKNMEIDQREGTNETFDVEDTNELNCGDTEIVCAEEQHQLRKKDNTTVTLESVAMPFNNTLNNGDMDFGEHVHFRVTDNKITTEPEESYQCTDCISIHDERA